MAAVGAGGGEAAVTCSEMGGSGDRLGRGEAQYWAQEGREGGKSA